MTGNARELVEFNACIALHCIALDCIVYVKRVRCCVRIRMCVYAVLCGTSILGEVYNTYIHAWREGEERREERGEQTPKGERGERAQVATTPQNSGETVKCEKRRWRSQ